MRILENIALEMLWKLENSEEKKKKKSSNLQVILWNTVKSCLDNMSHHIFDKLDESVPARLHVVLKAKEGDTKTMIF